MLKPSVQLSLLYTVGALGSLAGALLWFVFVIPSPLFACGVLVALLVCLEGSVYSAFHRKLLREDSMQQTLDQTAGHIQAIRQRITADLPAEVRGSLLATCDHLDTITRLARQPDSTALLSTTVSNLLFFGLTSIGEMIDDYKRLAGKKRKSAAEESKLKQAAAFLIAMEQRVALIPDAITSGTMLGGGVDPTSNIATLDSILPPLETEPHE